MIAAYDQYSFRIKRISNDEVGHPLQSRAVSAPSKIDMPDYSRVYARDWVCSSLIRGLPVATFQQKYLCDMQARGKEHRSTLQRFTTPRLSPPKHLSTDLARAYAIRGEMQE